MAVKVRDTMTADGKRFEKLLKELGQMEVRIGIQQEEESEDGTNLVEIAMYNELGTEHIPSRPFLRDSVDANGDKINRFLKSIKQKILQGSSAEEVFDKIGTFQKGLIQKQIVKGSYEENKEPYKSRKERKHPPAVPLVDTGRMRDSVNYVIQKKGSN